MRYATSVLAGLLGVVLSIAAWTSGPAGAADPPAGPAATQPVSRPSAEAAAEQVKRLGHEDLAAREAAVQALIGMGEKARAAVQKAATDKDPEVVRRAKEVLAALGEHTRGPDGQLLEELRGQKVLQTFWAVAGEPGKVDLAAHQAVAQRIRQALDRAGVKVVRVVGTTAGEDAETVSATFKQVLLLDCQGRKAQEVLKDVPHRGAGIVFKDGAFQEALPGPHDRPDWTYSRAYVFKVWGSGRDAMRQRDEDLARLKTLAGIEVDRGPGSPPGAGGSSGTAKIRPAAGRTLLEAYLITRFDPMPESGKR